MSDPGWDDRLASVVRVSNFAQLHDALRDLSAGWEGIGRVYRGHCSVEWSLVPKAGRPPYLGRSLAVYFAEWKRHARGLMNMPLEGDWEWLALAQHYGLATNLLDWTYNPLAAAFFAVAVHHACDAAVFSYRPDSLVVTHLAAPLKIEGIAVYKPFHIADRITRQMGLFTVHGPTDLALECTEANKLDLIIIDRAYRQRLMVDLIGYGINHATLFPDLDGLSEHINWRMVNDVKPHTL